MIPESSSHTSDNNEPEISFSSVSFTYQGASLPTLRDFSVSFAKNSSTAIVGESGSGKTTIAKLIVGLEQPTEGTIFFQRRSTKEWLSSQNRLMYRKKIQLLFQDPDGALNPKMKIEDLLDEVLTLHMPKISVHEKKERIEKALFDVSLTLDMLNCYSFELSGGQKQRITIARSLLIEPDIILLDEPLASLDASLKRSVITLLQKIQKERSIQFISITHDLTVVPYIAQKAIIIYRGVIVEEGDVLSIYNNPAHPYTKMLLMSIPRPDPKYEKTKKRLHIVQEDATTSQESSCVFAHRCPSAQAICHSNRPPRKLFNNRWVFCHFPNQ